MVLIKGVRERSNQKHKLSESNTTVMWRFCDLTHLYSCFLSSLDHFRTAADHLLIATPRRTKHHVTKLISNWFLEHEDPADKRATMPPRLHGRGR